MKSSVELLFEYVFDSPTFAMTTPGLERMTRPAPVHPFGPGYSMHPELSRSAVAYVGRSAALVALPFTLTTLFIASGTTAMAEEGGSPSSLFTGQPGVGSYMDQFMPY